MGKYGVIGIIGIAISLPALFSLVYSMQKIVSLDLRREIQHRRGSTKYGRLGNGFRSRSLGLTRSSYVSMWFDSTGNY